MRVLGFDQLRALALSLILIEALDNDTNRQKMAAEMVPAFHAAVQAEDFARLTKLEIPEDVFVATPFSRLGYIAFWALSREQSN